MVCVSVLMLRYIYHIACCSACKQEHYVYTFTELTVSMRERNIKKLEIAVSVIEKSEVKAKLHLQLAMAIRILEQLKRIEKLRYLYPKVALRAFAQIGERPLVEFHELVERIIKMFCSNHRLFMYVCVCVCSRKPNRLKRTEPRYLYKLYKHTHTRAHTHTYTRTHTHVRAPSRQIRCFSSLLISKYRRHFVSDTPS